MPGVRHLTEKPNCRRGCAQGLRHCPGDGSVLRTQETGARFEAGWDVEPPIYPSTFRRWDRSWIPGFPFRHLPSDRAEVPIVLFEMCSLGTMQLSPLPSLPSLRLEAVVERSCSACYKCPSPLFSVVFSVFFWSFSVRLDSALLLCSLPALQTLPVQCDPLAYCGTLVAAGYYPKYLGNLALPASERMNQTFNLEAWKAAVYQVTLKSGCYWIMAVCQAARFRPSVRSLRNQESSREGFRGR